MIRAVILASLLANAGCAASVAPDYSDAALAADRVDSRVDVASSPDVARDTGVVDAGRREYLNPFDDASVPIPEWSTRMLSHTPAGNQTFLGPIGRGVTTLTVGGWMPHRTMFFSITLFVLGSWDGNMNGAGPDLWEMRAHGSSPILHTTFANLDGNEITQAFPDDFPAGRHPSGAGSVSRDMLGYFYVFRQMNAVYRIERRFPHTDSTLVLEFDSQDAEASNHDEEWGIDDIAIVAEQ